VIACNYLILLHFWHILLTSCTDYQ